MLRDTDHLREAQTLKSAPMHVSGAEVNSTLQRVYKYRLYPTGAQEEALLRQLELCRRLYNKALWWREGEYKRHQAHVSRKEQTHALVDLKKWEPEYAAIALGILEDVLKRVDLAFKAFFRRCKANGEKPGYPRSKGPGWYKSITITRSREFKLKHGEGAKFGRLSFKGFSNIRVRMHRALPEGARVSRAQIKREASGEWYVCFGITFDVEKGPESQPERGIGIDVGLNSYIATSSGEHVPGAKCLKRSERRLAKAQRSLSKKKRGSNRRKKARTRVAKIHETIGNQRRDFQHNLSRRMVREHDLIAAEDLNVRGMVKNHYLAKAILDAAWSEFLAMIEYKAESAGTRFVKVSARNTSQECSDCGQIVKKTLDTRVHRCDCGLTLDRDVNAARNIHKRAVLALRGGE